MKTFAPLRLCVSLFSASFLSGCGTVDPSVVDAVTNAITNRPAPVVITNTPPPPPVATPETPSNGGPLGEPDGAHPPPFADAIDISTARTISKYVRNIPAMPIAGELRNLKLSADRVTFETSSEKWIAGEWGRIAILFRDTDGALIAGEFDARKPGQRMKGLENIHGGYILNKQPRAGDAVWFVVYDMKGTQRSNVSLGGDWK